MPRLFYVVCYFCFALVGLAATQTDGELSLADMVLQIRGGYGLSQGLFLDEVAALVSHQYAEVLFSQKNLAHMDVHGRNAIKRYRSQGGSALSTGEILGRGPNLESIVSMWLKSPTHRQVLLDPKWTAFGVGIYKVEETYVATVLFTTSISEKTDYVWSGNNLEVEIVLREGVPPKVWLQAGSVHALPVSIEDDRVLKFVLPSNGPERCLIFNSQGQGDLLVVPPRHD